ncbi:MAG: YqgE/AlgH family protein [Gammaproteobacteria bacterium]|nr:YqgE/AlgH family protein [Gammaproteobacteria bacterium]
MEIHNEQTQYLTNHFLIAMPRLDDINFTQSVTYICEHSAEGAMGVTINRPSDILLQDILQQIDIKPATSEIGHETIYHGGPVQTDRGFILHNKTAEQWEASLDVTDNIQLTSSKDILKSIANNQGPDKFLITLGYAGWASGQLEQEIASNLWLNCPSDSSIIFDTPIEKRWESAASLLGIDLQLLSNDAGHA